MKIGIADPALMDELGSEAADDIRWARRTPSVRLKSNRTGSSFELLTVASR